MRTIKSQDGKKIVNAERILSFNVGQYGDPWIIFALDSWAYSDSLREIGEYSTEKRALRVLDMLNEWLTMQRTYSYIQMPQDSEELDA